MCRLAVLLLSFVVLLEFSTTAFAEKRVALVIGNSAYAKTGMLANPANDARAIADLLRRAGFEISEARLDLGLAAFKRALSDFEVSSKGAEIAAFYFSGHGVQINNQDYLLPVDAELARDVDAQDEAVTLDRVLRATEGARRLRLVIIDACRDNPFVARMKNVVATRAVARGLAPPTVELADTLIAFAARDGTQAIDGAPGGNSPFAAAILRRLAEPGLDVHLAFRQVRDDVRAATNGKQEPYTYGSLGGGMVPIMPGGAAAPNLPAAIVDTQQAEFDAAMSVGTIVSLDSFLAKYPSGPLANTAQRERARLSRLQTAAVTPVAPAAASSANVSAAAGERVFTRCKACHMVGENAEHAVGPLLNGLAGRKAGSIDGYPFSAAMSASGITWSSSSFKEFVRNPRAAVPGTKMIFQGISSDKEIDDLWAYLNQFDQVGAASTAAAPLDASLGDGAPAVRLYGNWRVARKNGECFAVASPSDRLPSGLARDSAYVFVSNRRRDGVRVDEVSISMGFPMKSGGSASAWINEDGFELIAKETNVWVKNLAEEPQFVRAMEGGDRLVIRAASVRGKVTTDTYSLKGFSEAIRNVRLGCP